jgi:serine/threonine protein kinase
MANLVGKTLGKYQITELLGKGGMAEVYKAYHPKLERYVAIKVLYSFLAEGEDFLGRFSREAKAVASLRHPHIVQIHDFIIIWLWSSSVGGHCNPGWRNCPNPADICRSVK